MRACRRLIKDFDTMMKNFGRSRTLTPMNSDVEWILDREPGESDGDYSRRVEHYDRLFPNGRVAGNTADLTDSEMSLMRAGRVPPEHDYEMPPISLDDYDLQRDPDESDADYAARRALFEIR